MATKNTRAELPTPPGWKPSPKHEIISWVNNQHTQLTYIISQVQEDSTLAADIHIAIQINQKIGQLAAALP